MIHQCSPVQLQKEMLKICIKLGVMAYSTKRSHAVWISCKQLTKTSGSKHSTIEYYCVVAQQFALSISSTHLLGSATSLTVSNR